MNCPQCQGQLAAYVDELLDQVEIEELQTHLDNCPVCREELRQTRKLTGQLVCDGQAVSGTSLDARVMDRIVQEQAFRLRRILMKRISRIAAAAVVLVGVLFGVSQFFGGGNGTAALAQAAEQLKQAKTVSWTEVSYRNVTSMDKKTTWVETASSKVMWKAPGHLRGISLDAHGQVQLIRIDDRMKGISLWLEPGKKSARLTYPGIPGMQTGQNSRVIVMDMSQWLTKTDKGWIMGEPKPLGKKEINGREAIGYRFGREVVAHGEGAGIARSRRWSADLWVDAETKRLVLVHHPGLDVYDPEKDPARHNRPGEARSTLFVGYVYRDIVFDQELDDSLFSLDLPEGYEVTKVRTPEPAEKDMIDWLLVHAQFNRRVFPDDPGPLRGKAPEMIFREYKGGKELTSAEQKTFERLAAADRYYPVRRFVATIAGDSWHYAGKGVKLGDATAIVCWYKRKGSKTYRVVYGDLSIKDVAPKDLPLQAE